VLPQNLKPSGLQGEHEVVREVVDVHAHVYVKIPPNDVALAVNTEKSSPADEPGVRRRRCEEEM
jgi:hypothetical protein